MPVPLPDPCRLTRHALAVIERTIHEAKDGPVKPSPSVRLALGWLSYQRLAEPWQIEAFWHWLRNNHPDDRDGPSLGEYCRQRDMQISLTAWTNAARKRWP